MGSKAHKKKLSFYGDKLSEYELNLYEYSTFSLTEEIDIFYCKHKNPIFKNSFDDESLRDKI